MTFVTRSWEDANGEKRPGSTLAPKLPVLLRLFSIGSCQIQSWQPNREELTKQKRSLRKNGSRMPKVEALCRMHLVKPMRPPTGSGNNGPQVQQLQIELAQQKQAATAAESRATAAETRANAPQTQFNIQTADLEQQRNLLAAATATTSTAAAAEAAKINQLKEEMAKKDDK